MNRVAKEKSLTLSASADRIADAETFHQYHQLLGVFARLLSLPCSTTISLTVE